MDLPPAHFVKDEMQNRKLIVNGLTLKIKSGLNYEELRCNRLLNHCRKHCLNTLHKYSPLPLTITELTIEESEEGFFYQYVIIHRLGQAKKSRDAQNTTEVENGKL